MQTENILIQAGLLEEQATVYQALLEKGPQKAGPVAIWTGIKRGLVYKVLEQLEARGLVAKKGGTGTVTVYSPNHPSLLLTLLEQKEKEVSMARDTVAANLGTFLSQFNLNQGKPRVEFVEGIKGLEKVWADILSEGSDIMLIQSPDDRKHPDVGEKILKQIEKQVAKNIHVRAITPWVSDSLDWYKNKDEKNLVTRHIVSEKNTSHSCPNRYLWKTKSRTDIV
jgi:sugar-specific transcriptional regulator TrmB